MLLAGDERSPRGLGPRQFGLLVVGVLALLGSAAAASLAAGGGQLVGYEGGVAGQAPLGAEGEGLWRAELVGLGRTRREVFVAAEWGAAPPATLDYQLVAHNRGSSRSFFAAKTELRTHSVHILAGVTHHSKASHAFDLTYQLSAPAAGPRPRFFVLAVHPFASMWTLTGRLGLAVVSAAVWLVCRCSAPAPDFGPEQRLLGRAGLALALHNAPAVLLRQFTDCAASSAVAGAGNAVLLWAVGALWLRAVRPMLQPVLGAVGGACCAVSCCATAALVFWLEATALDAVGGVSLPRPLSGGGAVSATLATIVAVPGVVVLLVAMASFKASETHWPKLSQEQRVLATLAPPCLALTAGCGLWQAGRAIRPPLLLLLPLHAHLLLLQLAWARRERV